MKLSKFDTGEVLEPFIHPSPDEDKVDFDNEEGESICEVQVVRNPAGGYTVKVHDYTNGAEHEVRVGD